MKEKENSMLNTYLLHCNRQHSVLMPALNFEKKNKTYAVRFTTKRSLVMGLRWIFDIFFVLKIFFLVWLFLLYT